MKRSLATRILGRVEQTRVRFKDRSLRSADQVEYGIAPGYTHRLINCAYDDTLATDGWQREVYEAAAHFAGQVEGTSVIDVGCGSGFKLMKYFGKNRTVGFDTERTVRFLQRSYPDRDWRVSHLEHPIDAEADIVICSDVIEHIPNPDQLMEFLRVLRFKRLFLSTPDRDLLYKGPHWGPPANLGHCREWNMAELASYVAQWFEIEDHYISNTTQCTQLMILRPLTHG